MWSDIALILGAYLLGSVPHLWALGRLCGIDLDGDLHISLWRRGGRLVGGIGILIDLLKGMVPVLVGKILGFDVLVVTLAGLVAVCGQMWPIFYRFNGEKGNSTGLAMAMTLAPKPSLIALIPIAVGVAIRTVPRLLDARQSLNERLKLGGPPSRSLPLGMAVGFLVLPIASLLLKEPLVITSGYSALFILVMIRRLTAGLRADLAASTSIGSILVNRLLYDRSYLQVTDRASFVAEISGVFHAFMANGTRQIPPILNTPGDYHRALAGEDEIALSVPKDKIGELVGGINVSDII